MEKVIKTDPHILFRINSYKHQSETITHSIYSYNILEILLVVFVIVITFVITDFFSKQDNLTLGILLDWTLWILSFHYYTYLNEEIKHKREEREIVNEKIEKLLDFCAYISAYNHLKSIENGENKYPQLRINDSKYIVKKYKKEFEKLRIKFERDKIIDI
jgi:hypothetical protein